MLAAKLGLSRCASAVSCTGLAGQLQRCVI